MSKTPKQTEMNRMHAGRPWWREPMVWLVIGGPAVVVVAAIATAVIAVRNADPVLDTHGAKTAIEGRNHATTSGDPVAPAKP